MVTDPIGLLGVVRVMMIQIQIVSIDAATNMMADANHLDKIFNDTPHRSKKEH
jgi:hypothetical protein